MAGMLYLVGTPIGNLEDLSPRARRTLEEADFIAAEDTRVTLKLLNHFSLRKPLVSYYEHNKKAAAPRSSSVSPGAKPARWSPTRECPAFPTRAQILSACARKTGFRSRRCPVLPLL